MTIETIKALALWASPVLVPLVGGLVGTGLEALGAKYKIKALEGIGQRVEALFADIPKLLRGSRLSAATVAELAKKVESEK
jgi:hypothetical protein